MAKTCLMEPETRIVRDSGPIEIDNRRYLIRFMMCLVLGWSLGASASRAATLVADRPSPQPAGTTITFTLGADGAANALYRLSVGSALGPDQPEVVYDYSRDNVLEWTRIDPGVYRVVATVVNTETGEEQIAEQLFNIEPAVPPETSGAAVLPTSNPLVALYVAPPCPPPARMRVRFEAPGDGRAWATSPKRCEPGVPLHFQVAGMREQTTYRMQHEILGPGEAVIVRSDALDFTTGTALIAISDARITPADTGWDETTESLIWNSTLIGNPTLGLDPYIHATDLEGRLVWYLDTPTWAVRPSHGGTLWVIQPDPVSGVRDSVLAKVDLLGRVVKQTSVEALNRQLARLGHSDRINDIHHDVRDLPNGRIAFISTVERLVTGVQGPGAVSVLGDMILVTDQNFVIQWVWNGWDHLDPTRPATLGEVCTVGMAGCPPFHLAEQSNDWMHSNSLAYTPDGNLILSVRHQDWIVKVQYADGAGDGRVLWRLGPEGDFDLVGGEADDWFSHTHDASFISENRLLVYDNSNLRCAAETPPPDCQSRGQVWEIDERAMTAERVFNQELGEFAFAVGSAQRLLNGDYWFNSGMLGSFAAPRTTLLEVGPDSVTPRRIALDMFHYRSYRLRDLYSVPPAWDVPAWNSHPGGPSMR
jgi:arylsulfate sulfotransferase